MFEVSQLHMRDFTFQIGCEISHTDPGASAKFPAHERQMLWTLVGRVCLRHALHVHKPHFVLSIGVPRSLEGPNLHTQAAANT